MIGEIAECVTERAAPGFHANRSVMRTCTVSDSHHLLEDASAASSSTGMSVA